MRCACFIYDDMATPVSSPFDAKVAVHNYANHQI